MKLIITTLLNITLTSSVVILAVMLVRLFLRRCPKIYSYLLWTVVAFRLCVPISFESNFSIFNLGSQKGDEVRTAVQAAAPTATPVTSRSVDIYRILFFVWAIGVAALVIYGIFSYYKLQTRLSVSYPLYENVYGVEQLASPFVMGYFDPKIYIPFGLDNETESYVVMHERTHLKRGDHLVKLFAFVLLCIYWFNPLCWVAFILMSRDMEMSCDEKVLKNGNGISKIYSTALLSFAANKRFPSPGPLCFGEVAVKSRIKNVLKWKKPAIWITVICILLCCTVFIACASDAKVGEDKVVQPNHEAIAVDTTDTTADTSADTTADTTTADTTTADTTTEDTTTVDTTTADTTTADTTTAAPEPPETEPVVTQPPVTENQNYYYYQETEPEPQEDTDFYIEPPEITYPKNTYKEEGHDLLDDFINETTNPLDAVIIWDPAPGQRPGISFP